MADTLGGRAADLLGESLIRASVVAGGDLSEVFEIELADGRVAIVKGGPGPEIEAKMLAAIRSTGAPAPAVIASDDSMLVLERLPSKGQLVDAWPDLGCVLSKLHADRGTATKTSELRYGWPDDYAFGEVAIVNTWSENWPTFWGEYRLANQARFLPKALARRIENLASRLSDFLPACPTPALLHGDLWGGNILVSGQRVSGLIDPASYLGDCEVDIAMLKLFNQPDEKFFEAYGSLPTDHEKRLPIYQLWPALVHLRLFGSAYRTMVERMLVAVGV